MSTSYLTPPTLRQADVLAVIVSYRAAHGYSPTQQEIAGIMELSKPVVHEHVNALIAKKLLVGAKHKSRSLIPTSELTRRRPQVLPPSTIQSATSRLAVLEARAVKAGLPSIRDEVRSIRESLTAGV